MRLFPARSTQLAPSALKLVLVSVLATTSAFHAVQPASAALGSDTPIATPEGFKIIGDLAVGDQVSAGSLRNGAMAYAAADVVFSTGTGVEREPSMVYLALEELGSLIATRDQVFMLADGTLTTAAHLVPGHNLMGEGGGPVLIERVSDGSFNGAVHHIVATNTAFDGTSDGHLVLAQGVIVGDYLMEIHPPSATAALETVANPE